MNWVPREVLPLGHRINVLWKQGLRLVIRAAIAFGLSTAAAIGVGAAVTDSGLAQILVTVLAALAFWIPFFVIVLSVDKWLARRVARRVDAPPQETANADSVWDRLFALAPTESDRLAMVRQSIERSRVSLRSAKLDPDAHDLCVLIDRRLPELIHHELEMLPPDDVHRREQIRNLIDLVEQFARHCSRRGSADDADAEFRAKVLRRRFEARLSEF